MPDLDRPLVRARRPRTGRCATPAASSRPAGLRWHVQRLGAGPPLLLLHGTGGVDAFLARSGAAAGRPLRRSSRPTCPATASPTPSAATDLSLPGMARGGGGAAEGDSASRRTIVVGHSAGAAVAGAALPRWRDRAAPAGRDQRGAEAVSRLGGGCVSPARPGAERQSLAAAPVRVVGGIDREAAGRLIAGMGSKLDRRGLDLYARLLAKSGHCAGALADDGQLAAGAAARRPAAPRAAPAADRRRQRPRRLPRRRPAHRRASGGRAGRSAAERRPSRARGKPESRGAAHPRRRHRALTLKMQACREDGLRACSSIGRASDF